MPTDVHTNRLRESLAEVQDIFNKYQPNSLFDRTFAEVDATAGFFKPAAIALIGEPEEWNGSAVVNVASSASAIYETKIYQYTWGLDVNQLTRTDRLSRGAVTRMLTAIVRKWIGHRDRKLTTLLLTGESAGSLTSGGIFSTTTATVAGAGTVNNLHGTAVSGSANEVLAALHAGRGLLRGMRSAGNDVFRTTNPQIGLMYAPRGQSGLEEQYVMDALRPMLLNDKYRFGDSEVVPLPNDYLGTSADMWMFDLSSGEPMFLVGVEQEPDFLTTLGSTSSADRIMYRRALGATSYVYECAFSGDPYQAVLLNDA
jgi:hypothetical protein